MLTPCVSVTFDDMEPSPLYVLEGHAKKPRWKLRQGVGPPTLELDKRSKSTLIYAPTLRQYGLTMPPSLQSITETVSQTELAMRISRLEMLNDSTFASTVSAPLLTSGWSEALSYLEGEKPTPSSCGAST